MNNKKNPGNLTYSLSNSSHNLQFTFKNQKKSFNYNTESSTSINPNEIKSSKYFPYSRYLYNHDTISSSSKNISNSNNDIQLNNAFYRNKNNTRNGNISNRDEIKDNKYKGSDAKTEVKIIFVKRSQRSSSSSLEKSIGEKMKEENKNISSLMKQNLLLKSKLNQNFTKLNRNSQKRNSDKNNDDNNNNNDVNNNDFTHNQTKSSTIKNIWKISLGDIDNKIFSKRGSAKSNNIIDDNNEEFRSIDLPKGQRSLYDRISFLKKNDNEEINTINTDKKEERKKKTFVRRNTENFQSKTYTLKSINETTDNSKPEEIGVKKNSFFRCSVNIKNNTKENDKEIDGSIKNQNYSTKNINSGRKTRSLNIEINENGKLTENNENNNNKLKEESKTGKFIKDNIRNEIDNKNNIEKRYYFTSRNKKEERENSPKTNDFLEKTENKKMKNKNNDDINNDNNLNKTEIKYSSSRRFRSLKDNSYFHTEERTDNKVNNKTNEKLKDKIDINSDKKINDFKSTSKSNENLVKVRLFSEKTETKNSINERKKRYIFSKYSKSPEEDKDIKNKNEKEKNNINEKEEEKDKIKDRSLDWLKRKYESKRLNRRYNNKNLSPEQSIEKANLNLMMNNKDIEEEEDNNNINTSRKYKCSSNTFVPKKSRLSISIAPKDIYLNYAENYVDTTESNINKENLSYKAKNYSSFRNNNIIMNKNENFATKKQNGIKTDDMDFDKLMNKSTKFFNIPKDKLDKVDKEENEKHKINKFSIKKEILNFEENEGVDNSILNRKLNLEQETYLQPRRNRRHNSFKQKTKTRIQFSEKIKIEDICTSAPVVKFDLKNIINNSENLNLEKNLYLYNFDKKQNLIQFDIKNKSYKNYRINNVEDLSGTFSKDYHYQNTVFYNTLEGLFILTGEKSDLLYYYNPLYENFNKICKFKNEHNNGCLLLDKENGKFFVFGGKNTKSCEYYDIKNETVKELPNLNIDRANSTFIISNNKIFGFFGFSHKKDKFINTIEYINLYKLDKWVLVNINNYDLDFYTLNIPLLNLEISQNQIYIYCAKKSNDFIFVDDSYYVYNVSENNLKKCTELSHRICRSNEKASDRKKYEFDKRGYFFDKNSRFIKIPDGEDIKGCEDNTFVMIDNESNIHYITYSSNNLM